MKFKSKKQGMLPAVYAENIGTNGQCILALNMDRIIAPGNMIVQQCAIIPEVEDGQCLMLKPTQEALELGIQVYMPSDLLTPAENLDVYIFGNNARQVTVKAGMPLIQLVAVQLVEEKEKGKGK
jgi:hypothetical protein